MAVRYDQKFMNEIKGIVNAYNRKIARLTKADNGYVLPERFGKEAMQKLKMTATSRADVRRRLKDLQSFTARGGEKNIKVGKTTMPKYLHTNIKRYRRILRLRTTKEMKRFETRHPIQNGKKQPFTFSQYGSQDYLTLRAKRLGLAEKDLENLDINELKDYLHSLTVSIQSYQRKMNAWQENYISMLEDSALSYGYEPDKLEVIVERLRKLSPEEFDDLSFVNRNILAVVYHYKALENIETAKELKEVGEDVISNLDSIYENLDEILAEYE